MRSVITFTRRVVSVFLPCVFLWSTVVLGEVDSIQIQVQNWQKEAYQALLSKDYVQAEQLYDRILHDSSIPAVALDAHKGLATLYIVTQRFPEADAQIQMLKTQFSAFPETAEALYSIARQWEWNGQPQKAAELHTYNSAAYPAVEKAMFSQVEVINDRIANGDMKSAETEYALLLERFGSLPTLSKEIYQIGQRYLQAGQAEKAQELHRYNSTSYFEKYALYSQVEIFKKALEGRDFSGAQTAYETLVDRFNNQPALSKEIYQIAKGYAQADVPGKALELHRYNAAHSNDLYGMYSQVETAYFYIGQGDDVSTKTAFGNLIERFSTQPTLVKETRNILNRYTQKYGLGQAAILCESTLNKYPAHSMAAYLAGALIPAYIQQGNVQQAEEQVDIIFAKYSENESIVAVMLDTCRAFLRAQDYGKVLEIYLRLLENYPHHEKAIEMERGVITVYLAMGAKATADERVGRLVAEFAEHPSYSVILNSLADAYRSHRYYTEAIDLYQTALAQSPGQTEMLCAYTGLARCSARMGNSEEVDRIVNLLFSGYLAEKRIDYSLFVIGEEYYMMGCLLVNHPSQSIEMNHLFNQATPIWERIIADLPDTNHAAHSFYSMGMINWHRKEYANAIPCFAQLIQKWPSYSKTPDAIVWCARCYNTLCKEQKLSPAEIEASGALVDIIASAGKTKEVLDLCAALGEIKYQLSKWKDATKYLELCLTSPKTYNPNPEIYYMLAQSYEKQERIDQAIRYYRTYIDSSSLELNEEHIIQSHEQLATLMAQ